MADRDYWMQIAEQNPWWAVLSHDRYRGPTLGAADQDAFFAEGERDIDFTVSSLKHHFADNFAPQRALDFGCGVGRLTLPMARHAAAVTGFDISPAMLKLAETEARERGIPARFVLEIPNETFDWINSFIVFQHIEPSKGIVLLEKLLERLTPQGYVSLHFSIYRDARIWHRGAEELEFGRYDGRTIVQFSRKQSQEMPIFEYDLSEVTSRFVAHGIETLFLRHTDHGGLHGVWIFGRRGY